MEIKTTKYSREPLAIAKPALYIPAHGTTGILH